MKLAPKPPLAGGDAECPGRKKLEIARALAARPKLLLLDEVMPGLDATEIEEVVSLIKSVRDRGVTIVVIEHILQTILGLSDRVIVLRKIARIGSVYLGSRFQD